MGIEKQNDVEEGRRDSGYPIYPLDEALKISQAIVDLGGSRSPVSKEMLAKHLRYAPTGPSFVQRIGTAKTFGLISGRGDYSLTELGTKYYFPASDADKLRAAFDILKTPKAFQVIVARFHGTRIPSPEMMGNIMHTDASVPPSWKDRVATLFVRSAKAVGLLDESGLLRSDQKPDPIVLPLAKTEIAAFTINDEISNEPGTHSYILPLANQRKVIITAPTDITAKEISRVQKWIEVTLLVEWGPNDG